MLKKKIPTIDASTFIILTKSDEVWNSKLILTELM